MKIKQSLFQNRLDDKNNKPTVNVSFGQILPEHLFINSQKYEKNQAWAFHVIDVLEQAKTKIDKNTKFGDLMNFISTGYGKFFAPSSNDYGRLRTKTQVVQTFISEKNRYSPYLKPLMTFANEEGASMYTDFSGNVHKSKVYKTYLKPNQRFFKTELSRLLLAKDKLSQSEIEIFGKHLLLLESVPPKSIKPTFKKIEPIYEEIKANNEELSPQNIQKLTKGIAKIHWYLSQLTPYCRGSAGIADAFAKTMFEAKGIQVSPYRPKIDPNLEAFTMTIEEYTQRYQSFFSKPLRKVD